MAVYSLFFSPTGGTRKVARALCSAWDRKLVTEIDMSQPNADLSTCSFSADDLCLIVSPVYEGRIPATVLQRLSVVKANGTPAVFAVVYGNRHFNDALLEMKDTLLSLNFVPFAGITANAEHSILRHFGTGRPDADDLADLTAFSSAIKAHVDSGAELTVASVPGKTPYIVIPSKTSPPAFDRSLCTYCGRCVFDCPVQALSKEIETDEEVCIRCMRCVSVCPTNARFIPSERIEAASARLGKFFEGRKPNKLFADFVQ